jgi:hypothetical protein
VAKVPWVEKHWIKSNWKGPIVLIPSHAECNAQNLDWKAGVLEALSFCMVCIDYYLTVLGSTWGHVYISVLTMSS